MDPGHRCHTVKPLYGRQQGAEIGHNPHKPGRPSHAYHSYFMANLIALAYNCRHLYARLYDGDHHREAITSRPALLNGVARLTRSGGQRTVKVSVQHERSDRITAAITRGSNTLRRFHSIAEQWSILQRWALLLTHIFRRWLGEKWLGHLPPEAHLVLSG